MSQKTCLYQDPSVRIFPDEIQILEYYFPLPINKTINMCDVKQVNLKTDVNKHQKYLQVVVKGFSMNATFSPKDPQKCLDIIRSHSSFELAGKNIQQATTDVKTDVKAGMEEMKSKAHQKKEDIKEGAKQMKHEAQKKWQEGKQQAKEAVNKQPGVIESVTSTLSKGWQEVKQVSHEIYDAAKQKIHEMTAPQTEQKVHQAKQHIKQGARDIKEGAQDIGKDVQTKYEEGKYQAKKATGMQPEKTVYQNVKESAAKGLENLKQGAQNVYEKAAQKVSEVVGTDAESKAKQAKEDFKKGAQETKQSFQKATLPQKSATDQAKQKLQQWTGTDAKGKAQDAKQHFKQGAEDAKQSAKKATGYEGSKLQQAKQNIAQGWQSTKKSAQNVYDQAAKKLSDVGSSIQETVGQKTKQAGQALKEKGNQMEQNA